MLSCITWHASFSLPTAVDEQCHILIYSLSPATLARSSMEGTVQPILQASKYQGINGTNIEGIWMNIW